MSAQLSPWITGCVRRQSLLSGGLLLAIFGCLVYGLADAVQGIERGLFWPLVLIGLLLGWGLACSPLPGWLSALLGLLAGIVLVLLRVGKLGAPLLNLLGASLGMGTQLVRGIVPPDVAGIQTTWTDLARGGGTLIARLQSWLLNLAGGQTVFDPVPIALFWGIALWATVMWATWLVRRRAQPLLALTPAFALLAAVLAGVGGRAFYLLPMLIAALVLKALVGHERRERRWQQLGLRIVPRVRSDSLWLASGLSMVLVVLAALTPSISVYRIGDLIRSLSSNHAHEDELARSLGLEPQPEPAVVDVHLLDAVRAPGLPTRHLIGSGPELAHQLVMDVRVESVRPDDVRPIVAENEVRPTYYWRGLTYERYTDRGWSTEYAVRVKYGAGEPAIPDSAVNGRLLRQHVRLAGRRDRLVYVAGSLVTTDRDYQVAWRARPTADQAGDIFGATVETHSYWADSLVADVSEEALRSAGQDYPVWVAERYLELPDSLPARVRTLARDLTATELTPYDRARAIEGYLRTLPYTLDLPAPPPERDIVDYFLFELKRGYCDYYASAMVVLARAAGLPARLVTGYLSGTWNEVAKRYLVTEDQAHAWVEVYYPGHGWIEFDPTAGRPAIERPEAHVPRAAEEQSEPLEPITASRSRVRTSLWLGIAGGLLALGLVAASAWFFIDGWRLQRMVPEAAVVHLYRRLYPYGRGFGVPPRAGDTPREFAANLQLRLSSLREGRRWGAVLATAPEEIGWLTDLCTRALYAHRQPQATERDVALHRWRRLRVRLWLARLFAISG